MLYIQGEETRDTWLGHVRSVDAANQSVSVNFYVKSTRWPDRNLYVRKTYDPHAARQTVNYKSILNIAQGEWVSANSWRLL